MHIHVCLSEHFDCFWLYYIYFITVAMISVVLHGEVKKKNKRMRQINYVGINNSASTQCSPINKAVSMWWYRAAGHYTAHFHISMYSAHDLSAAVREKVFSLRFFPLTSRRKPERATPAPFLLTLLSFKTRLCQFVMFKHWGTMGTSIYNVVFGGEWSGLFRQAVLAYFSAHLTTRSMTSTISYLTERIHLQTFEYHIQF